MVFFGLHYRHTHGASLKAHAYFIRHNEAAIQGFANMLRHRQRRGLARPDLEPEAVARRLVAVWDGLRAQWLVAPTFPRRGRSPLRRSNRGQMWAWCGHSAVTPMEKPLIIRGFSGGDGGI